MTAQQHTNPFFEKYSTPHGVVPFDSIRLEDYEPAIMEGIRRDNEQLERIVANEARPTFDNTVVVRDEEHEEDYYDLLGRVTTVFFNQLSANTNDDMDALAQKLQPILTQHANDMRLNPKLFERIRYVHRHHRRLTPEEKRLLDSCYEGFVRSGALLSDEGKERLRALTEELSMLSLQFSQNLLKEKGAWQLHVKEDNGELAGLPQTALRAAEQEARQRELEGWVFTLDYPSYSPFMTYADCRPLREQMSMAYNTLCTGAPDAQGAPKTQTNNLDICRRIVNLRREVAQLLGFKTYADYVLTHRMASKPKGVYALLDQLIDAYKPQATKEVEGVRDYARKLRKDKDFTLQAWDFGYYANKLRLKRYNIDEEMLRPYFKLENVIDGVFGLANRLYGITFKENSNIPVYHPDVKAYEVFDDDGAYLAVFYADFHPRKGKQGGAWMTEYQGQWIDTKLVKDKDGKVVDKKTVNVRPHVSVVMNLTKPTADKPALLTLSEVETFLHEFGHSLHGMFANTRFESLSGTNVWWDFVELPSQFMENYAIESDFLKTFARHYETGELLPDSLIARIAKSRNFIAAHACMRQVSLGLLDMAYYTLKDELTDDIIPFEKRAGQKAIIGKQREDTCMTTQFSHIMAGGYAAGYYSYKWAEVLDADAFSVFKRNGIFDRQTARSFRDNILSKGGTEHPMTLYRRFRGTEPTIDALLRRNGIKRRTNKRTK